MDNRTEKSPQKVRGHGQKLNSMTGAQTPKGGDLDLSPAKVKVHHPTSGGSPFGSIPKLD